MHKHGLETEPEVPCVSHAQSPWSYKKFGLDDPDESLAQISTLP
jgi:hypothetical protein